MSDLISRDVLFCEISNIINRHENKPLDVSWLVPSDGLIMALVSILKAPAVEAVEVVHAEWINRPKTCVFVCSACKREVRTFHTNSVEEAESEFPYCHCGAKMDKRRESEVSE